MVFVNMIEHVSYTFQCSPSREEKNEASVDPKSQDSLMGDWSATSKL